MTDTKMEYDPLAKARRAPLTPCALTKEQEKLWAETRTKTLYSAPMFSHILYTMLRPGDDGPVATFTTEIPIAATDGLAIYLNPGPFFAMPLEERVFVIAHEVLHCVFDHCAAMHAFRFRQKVSYPDGKHLPYIPELMNMAQDYVINAVLKDSQVGTMPSVGLINPQVAGPHDSAMDVYRKLYEQAKKSGGKAGGKGQGGGGFDILLDPGQGQGKDPQQTINERSPGEWKAQVQAAVSAAKAMGHKPGALERIFGGALDPVVSWQDKIKGFFARRVGSGGYDWRRADRRLITRDEPVFAPGRSGFGAGTIVVGVDTSGSVGGPTLDAFMAEMSGILDDVRPKRLIIVWCDAKVNRVDEAEDAGDLNVIRAKGAVGGGGTSFVPVFDWIAAQNIEIDALVYLTDLMGSFPSHEPTYPVLWGSIYPEGKAPFGEIINIPVRNG